MSHMKNQLIETIEAIDFALGEGYAKKNPELIGRLIQADHILAAASMIQDGLYFLGSDIDDEVAHIM